MGRSWFRYGEISGTLDAESNIFGHDRPPSANFSGVLGQLHPSSVMFGKLRTRSANFGHLRTCRSDGRIWFCITNPPCFPTGDRILARPRGKSNSHRRCSKKQDNNVIDIGIELQSTGGQNDMLYHKILYAGERDCLGFGTTPASLIELPTRMNHDDFTTHPTGLR